MEKKFFNLLFSVLFLTLYNFSLFAQSSKITGIVTDIKTGEPLVGANITIKGTVFGAAANIDGNYLIINVSPGEYQLKASYIGYEDKVISITAVAGKTLEVNFELKYSGANLDDVVVTAQARGQMNAINDQLNSRSIKNVISAERMQDLPDANAAETIGRLPGVSIQRDGGEGSKVVVRGLSPKYSKITLEGVSMAASGSDRSSDISMISPYSLDGIEVIKSATAEYDADFVGGLINFKLRDADPYLKYDIVAQGGYNNLKSTSSDFMITGNVSNRFFDNKLGVYLQGNIEQRNRSSNELSAAYNNTAGISDPLIGVDNQVYTSSFTLSDIIRNKSRYGATLVLDYSLTNGVIHFKNFYSSNGTKIDRYNEYYSIANRGHGYIGRREEYNIKTFSNILDYEQRFNNLLIEANLSHSYSGNDKPKDITFNFSQPLALPTDVKPGAIAPYDVVKYASLDDTLTLFNKLTEQYSFTDERQIESALNLQYNFAISNQVDGFIKIGGKYRNKARFHDRTKYGSNLNLGKDANNAILDAYPWMRERLEEIYGIPVGYYTSKLTYLLFQDSGYDHKDFLEGKYFMGSVPNLDLLEGALGIIRNTDFGNNKVSYSKFSRSSTTYDYSGRENYYAGYIMAELNFGKYVKFIPGVRYEKNKTVYTGIRGIADPLSPELNEYQPYSGSNLDTTLTRVNEFLLPMIHLKISPTDWFDVRLAYTQTLSRPSYRDFIPRIDVWNQDVTWNNYKLKPEFSENFDLYFSFQENHLGLFTLGAFAKNIKNMIFNLGKRVILDTTYTELPASYANNKYIYTSANNENNAKVWGLEFDWQTNFWYLPSFLKGFVLNINYTHIFSEAKYPYSKIENHAVNPWDSPIWANNDTTYTAQFIDQPDDIINVQIGYDYKGFSSRISMFYQSRIFKAADYWPELSQYADEYLRWDFSVKQNLPWYGIQLFCNINNITSAKDRDLVQGAQWDAKIQHYGMTSDLGLRIKL